MKTLNSPSVLLSCCFLLASLFGSSAAMADEAADREAIHALLWRYTRALDTLNAEAYAAVFTADGEFRSGSTGATKGKQALMDMVNGVKAGQDERRAKGEAVGAMYHMTMDSWVEFIDATHARHHSYWQTVFGATGPGTSPRVAAAGRGIDDLVKVGDQWLIQTRDVAPQD
jgi:hypothetical protein